jgi:hypothetical protein
MIGGVLFNNVSRMKPAGWYALVTVVSLIVSILGLLVLPELGFDKLMLVLSPMAIGAMVGGIFALEGYIYYLRWVFAKPDRMFLIYALTLDLVVFTLHTIEDTTHLSLKTTTWSALFYTVPFVFILLRGKLIDFRRVPLATCMLLFLILNTLYYLIYNHHAVDMLFSVSGAFVPLDWTRLVSTLNIALLLLTTSKFLQTLKNPDAFFENFSKYFFWLMLVLSVAAIVFYPFGILTVEIGIKRMALIFTHPNAFAHHLTVSICYLAGTAFYFMGKNQTKLANKIFLSLPVLFIALGTSGSKSPLIQVTLGLLIVGVLEVIFNRRRIPILTNPRLMITTVLAVLVLAGGAVAMGVIDNFQKRFEGDESLQWRYRQWARIVANIDPDKIIYGHGHTAAITITQRYVYNTWNMRDDEQESPYVHNSILEHFFDYGLLGMIWLVGFLYSAWLNIKNLFDKTLAARYKSLNIACLSIFVIQMIGLGFDESFYMPSPIAVWALWTIQFFIATQYQYARRYGLPLPVDEDTTVRTSV